MAKPEFTAEESADRGHRRRPSAGEGMVQGKGGGDFSSTGTKGRNMEKNPRSEIRVEPEPKLASNLLPPAKRLHAKRRRVRCSYRLGKRGPCVFRGEPEPRIGNLEVDAWKSAREEEHRLLECGQLGRKSSKGALCCRGLLYKRPCGVYKVLPRPLAMQLRGGFSGQVLTVVPTTSPPVS